VGRTIPTYRLHLESILNDWMDYRRALREKDRETFDRIISKARRHASAASYCAHMDPTVLAILSVLLEMEKENRAERYIHMNMDTQDGMARSFSDVIRRLGKRRKSLLEFAGAWADIPDEEFQEMEAAWKWANQPLEEAFRTPRRKRIEVR
jgi:predicted CopG family antitoxin